MKKLLTIIVDNTEIVLIDFGEDVDVTRRYMTANGQHGYPATDYFEARKQFVSSFNEGDTELDIHGEPVGLHEMECNTIVAIPDGMYH